MHRFFFAALLVIASATFAQPHRHVTAGANGTCVVFEPILRRTLEWTGGRYEENTDIQAVAPGPDGRVLALEFGGGNFTVVDLDPTGGRRTLTGPRLGYAYALAAARDGPIYILADASPTVQIVAFDPSGNYRASFPLPGDYHDLWLYRSNVMDLAADQCTLFVIDAFQTIRRFNVCTGQSLPDFASAEFPIYASLRVLPDGGLLVGTDGGLFHRFDEGGVLTRSYPVRGDLPFALMLESGGRLATYGYTVYPGCTGQLETIDLKSGNAVANDPVRTELPMTLAAYYGWAAAIGSAHAAEAPSVSTVALVFLAMAIAGIAILRLR